MFGVLFFLSGATGLVYQLLWVRLLYQSFGSTIESVTTVVCAFLGGLGLGAWWLGRRTDRHRRPAELYGWLEIGIAICGVGSPYVLDLAHRTYLALMISGQVPGAGVALRFGLASLVLLVPTTLMGGTLPALTRAVTAADRTRLESVLSRFYAANTLGAMLGAATAGFFLIEHAGIRASLWGAAAVNAGLAVAALILARSVDPIHQPVAAPAQIDLGRVPPWMPRAAFALLVTTAFASLLAEIAWTRVLVLLVAGSTYAFTLIVTVFLAGLGIGGALVSGPGRSRSRSVADAALAQGIVAAGSGLVFLSVTWLPEYLLRVFADPATGPVERLIWLLVPVGAVVLIPAIGMGMTFPLLTDLSAPPGEARGSDVGRAYAVNTIGSVIGAALTGFVLISAIGTQATLRVGTFLSTGAAIVLILGASRSLAPEAGRHPLRSRILGAAFLSGIGLSAALFAPRWDTARLDLGPAIYGRELRTAADRRGFLRHRGARQIAFREGRNAAVSVWDSNVGRGLSINGKADASDDVDMETQVMLGIAPLAARPTARSALVIGLGSGVTTRVAADAPTMERVRVVEIEPAVVAMSQFFAHVNDFVLRRPLVSIVTDDARSALQVDTARYDLIVSEPSNPWLAGVATLYTPEFFRIARARLTDDGVFCQWVQTYQVSVPVVATLVGNMQQVFSYVEVWAGVPGDLIVLGSARPFAYSGPALERLFVPHSATGEMIREYLGTDTPTAYLGRRLLAASDVRRLTARATLVHDDDRPVLEFVAARQFMDLRSRDVFDSVVALAGVGRGDSSAVIARARALSVRRWDLTRLKYVEAAYRVAPRDDYWSVQLGGLLLAENHPEFADSALRRLLRTNASPPPDAWLLSGVLNLRAGRLAAARAQFTRALAAGADTAETSANLAVVAVREGRWSEAIANARRGLEAARGTARHPYPMYALREAWDSLALRGPADEVERLLTAAVARRPNIATIHEHQALAALRAGNCDSGIQGLLQMMDFGYERADAADLVARCRRGERF